MPDNVDEDLIEATIRRVAEAKAARNETDASGAPDDAEETGEPPLQTFAGADSDAVAPSAENAAHEDLIQATIRRVAEAKAAVEATPHDDAAPHADAMVEDDVDDHRPAGPDEDAIAATIARVQAQKAAADAVADTIQAVRLPEAPDEDAIAATIRRVQAQKAAQELRYDDDDDYRQDAVTDERSSVEESPVVASVAAEHGDDIATFEPVSEVSANDDAIARLERSLRDAHHALAALTTRVDALEHAATQQQQRAQISALPVRENVPAEVRQPAPPRPAILRDAVPAPRTALAERIPAPEVIDTRPLPEPLPPIHVEPRRGLDLLPRTYRITVEDKRRGVDLVPLHRALLSMDGVRDMSLLSYNNGVAIVSLETNGDLDGDALGTFVGRAMSREAKVEQHNEHTFVVKLAED